MVCVYQITNKENGKFYIGSTCDLKRRLSEHFGELRRKEHYSTELQNDYNIFGRDSFVVSILEECEVKSLRDREQYYIDKFNPVENGYNQSTSAYANNVPHPMYGENNPFYGKHHTEETKAKLRNNGKMHIGTKHSEETKKKMSKKAKRGNNANATKILQYDLDMNFLKEWDCVADICEFYCWASHTHITNCCQRNILHKRSKWSTGKGFIWMYKDAPKRKKVV